MSSGASSFAFAFARVCARACAFAAALAGAGCAGEPPPLSTGAPAVPVHTPGLAKIVFLWPPDICEQGGYASVATVDGRFVGNVARGTRLAVDLPPASYDLVAFNPRVEAAAGATLAGVAVLHADLLPDRTYFVRFEFGEWDVRGPRRDFASRKHSRIYGACRAHDAALVAMSPARSDDWDQLRDWLDDLVPVAPDRASGQRWLDADRAGVALHRQLAADRALALDDAARDLTSLRARDGVRVVSGPPLDPLLER